MIRNTIIKQPCLPTYMNGTLDLIGYSQRARLISRAIDSKGTRALDAHTLKEESFIIAVVFVGV